MKLLSRTVFPALLLLIGGSPAWAADSLCGCMFVTPPKPSGVSVERDSRRFPDPPPLFVLVGDALIINGTPDAALACQTVDAKGQVVTTIVHLSSRPPRQRVPCQATAGGESVPDFDKKRKRLDPRLLSANREAPLIWSPHYAVVRADNVDFQFNLPDREASYNLRIADDEGKKLDTMIKASGGRGGGRGSGNDPGQPPLTPFRWGGDQPGTLQAGHSYRLQIAKAGLGEIYDDAVFKVIPSKDDELVKIEIAGIDSLEIGDHSKRLLRATVYGAHDLYIDAVAQLRFDPETRSDPEALRMLGDLYRLGASYRAAEAGYLASLRPLATANDSAAGQALSHESLGVIHEALGNASAASEDYTQAQRLYASFGDSQAAKRMTDAIARLK